MSSNHKVQRRKLRSCLVSHMTIFAWQHPTRSVFCGSCSYHYLCPQQKPGDCSAVGRRQTPSLSLQLDKTFFLTSPWAQCTAVYGVVWLARLVKPSHSKRQRCAFAAGSPMLWLPCGGQRTVTVRQSRSKRGKRRLCECHSGGVETESNLRHNN